MYPVKDKNKTIYFSNKVDADNYIDYLQAGLKVIKKSGKTYHFNNGARLINVSLPTDTINTYVLKIANKTICNAKLQSKYIKAIKEV